MKIPMPSPRGTNREGLFLSASNSSAAYDAAAEDESVAKLLEFLKGKLSDSDFAQVCSIIAPGAMDDPPPFKGKPEMGGALKAMDRLPPAIRAQVRDVLARQRASNEASFHAQFPSAARISVA